MLAGWAADLDAAAGTGIATLHVWAYPPTGGAPVFLGTPTLGGARPDVAAVHGDQFRESGFGLSVQGLIPGTYDLAVFPWSNVTGAFAPPNIRARHRALIRRWQSRATRVGCRLRAVSQNVCSL